MKKRLLTLVLAGVMVVGCSMPAFAEEQLYETDEYNYYYDRVKQDKQQLDFSNVGLIGDKDAETVKDASDNDHTGNLRALAKNAETYLYCTSLEDGRYFSISAWGAVYPYSSALVEEGEIYITKFETKIDAPEVVELVYTGEEQTGVEEGTHYSLTDATGTDAGTYTAIATPDQGYAWKDKTIGDKEITWSIAAAPMTDDMASAVSDQEYAGKAITPVITLMFNGKELVEGKDFTIEYKDNTNPGQATIRVIGMGNFEGEINKTFMIIQKPEEKSGMEIVEVSTPVVVLAYKVKNPEALKDFAADSKIELAYTGNGQKVTDKNLADTLLTLKKDGEVIFEDQKDTYDDAKDIKTDDKTGEMTLERENYTLTLDKDGKLAIQFAEEFFGTLDAGDYSLKAALPDGAYDINFTIK